MNLNSFLRSVGGRPLAKGNGEIAWDFGMRRPDPTIMQAMPDFHAAAPALAGKWDGKASISLWQGFEKAVGYPLKAQYQPRGTCVGRGCSAAGNLLQGSLILAGKNVQYRPLSHAWVYAGAREKAGMLHSYSDGAVGAYAALWGQEKGVLAQEDAIATNGKADTNYYGQGSDDIAVQWGYSGAPRNLFDKAITNPFQEVVVCKNFQQAADAIASGAVVTVASNQGFTMTRDSDGFCRPSGSWAHQMHFGAVIVTSSGKRGLGCGQSWGTGTPGGPLLAGCPDHVFGVDENTVNRMLAANDSCVIGAFKYWEVPTIPWIFL